ncbi:MAG: hypothetical protein V2I67_17590 [Thermoanaerobaculales bacterium]|jgi:hypothetical protein|nr:hypothetical protein [Thermoanaerobaculales bacterium]
MSTRVRPATRTWIPVLLALICSIANAQTSIEPTIVNPGARSLSLGGAFVAVADDATAAWVNPSGLTQLVRPEVSLDLRGWIDDRGGIVENLSGLGFVSFVLPQDRWAAAVYGQTLASADFTDTLAIPGEISLGSSLTVVNLGVSASLHLSDDLSIGLGLTTYAGTFDDDDVTVSSPLSFDNDVETEVGATAGILWSPGEAWAFGASFRSGADLVFDSGSRANLPDTTAAGVRWRSAGGSATIAAELEHLSGFESRTRAHVGSEWVFLKATPLIGLRAGAWYDPCSRADDSGCSGGDGVFHLSGGVGVAWKRFQLDIGGDASDRTAIISFSGIFTF